MSLGSPSSPEAVTAVMAVRAAEEKADGSAYGPWNPGISSTLPVEFYPLATLLHSENSSMSLAEILELAGHSGLDMHSIAETRPERLLLHEILIRVTTELSVVDGPSSSDLGFNFRKVVTSLAHSFSHSFLQTCLSEAERVKADIEALITKELARIEPVGPPAGAAPGRKKRTWIPFFSKAEPAIRNARTMPASADTVIETISRWRSIEKETQDPLTRACCAALHKAANGIVRKQGRLAGHEAILKRIAEALAFNDHASERIGALLDAPFAEPCRAHGLRLLPSQRQPIVMNTKGASAAGKSSLRPRQRALARRIGTDWSDFAIISPDIWRKQLLDYTSLGRARRYAGMLTAHEVEVIDRKLDRYIAARARNGRITHMLIDRFRFDSFAPEGADDNATQLLTRFGSEVYMFFVITPPEATVERAWTRGEMVGRYKAVDDLLAHNIEAYSGFPGLFFRWSASVGRTVHYEFLDNSVREGEAPRTVAFGLNGEMTVLDADKLLDLDRNKHINISAQSPSEVYLVKPNPGPAREPSFLSNCLRRVPRIVFAEHATGIVYAVVEQRNLTYFRADIFERAVRQPEAKDLLQSMAMSPVSRGKAMSVIDRGGTRTLGAWGAR